MNKRDFLKLLPSFGLGVITAELYERLFHIPALEKAFREEVTYWIEQYRRAEEQLEATSRRTTALEDEVRRAREELQKVGGEVASLESLLREKEDEAAALRQALAYRDQLEEEALRAVYQEKLEEAISGLRRTVEKYRALLGEDKVAFESAVVKILEEYKITQEKLARLEGMFPLVFLSWTPARVVLDKIYDVRVDVEIVNPLTPVTEVEISLIPVEYRYMIQRYGMTKEDYYKVFPREEVRTVKLRASGLIREVFSTVFENLAGGREYVIKVVVRDLLNRTKSVEAKTPYIRQYENFAASSRMNVGAHYYPWYHPATAWLRYTLETPLLGQYSSRDPVVISKHIDWASGHGIDFLVVSWWGPDSFPDTVLRNYILTNSLVKDIKIVIFYETLGRLKVKEAGQKIELDDENRKTLLSDFAYLARYFAHPSYLRVDGKCAVVIYSAWIFEGDVEGTLAEMRDSMQRAGCPLFIIGDVVYWHSPDRKMLKLYDAVTAYSMYISIPEVLSDFENKVSWKYGEWSEATNALGVGFIPSAIPGFDDRAIRMGHIPLPKSTERFRKQLIIARQYTNINTILITTFNEWHESTNIEPSVKDGFSYLQVLKQVLLEEA